MAGPVPFLGDAAAQGFFKNKLSNARTSKVCMASPMGTVPNKLKRGAGGREVLHDFYTIISLSSLGEVSIRRVKVV